MKWLLHLMPKNSMQQSILLPSSKFGITPPVVNIGAWQCACSLCLQQAMVPVFDRKWPCAQQSFGFPVTEGDFALVAEIRDRYVALETVHHNHRLSVDLWHLVTSTVEFLMKPICMKSWSLQLYIYHSPFRPLKDWRRVERRHVPATAVCLAGLVGRGRKIISWATCASDTSHESCVCPPCSTCTTAAPCVVCRDARFFIIFSGRWTPEGLPAAQHCCSEKSSQLQSNMSYAFVILWRFNDVSYHFRTVSIILQINVFDGGQCTRDKVSLISCVCKGLKTSIWGKASICTNFRLKGGPKFGQDGGMMTASKIWPTTMTPHISGCRQVQGLNICTVFVHRWPFSFACLVKVDIFQ